MSSDTINKVTDKFGICNAKKEDKGINFTHVCSKNKKHEGKHKCYYCSAEWENGMETGETKKKETVTL